VSSLQDAAASVMVAGKCEKGSYINFKYEHGSQKLFTVRTNGLNFLVCRKYNKAGRPMEGCGLFNEDFSYFSKKSQSSAFFKPSITLTPRFVEQVYRFMAVIPRIRQVTLSIATKSYNSERF